MSNLGKIYCVDLVDGRKEAYPVVYENKEYYVCKQHGSYKPRMFDKCSLFERIYTVEQFNTIVGRDKILPRTKIFIFEPPHVKIDFVSLLTNKMLLLRSLEREVDDYEHTQRYWQDAKDKRVMECQEHIDSLEEKIQARQNRIDKIKQELKELGKVE